MLQKGEGNRFIEASGVRNIVDFNKCSISSFQINFITDFST